MDDARSDSLPRVLTTHSPRDARTGDARTRAAEALTRVEREGAFASAVLDASLDRSPALSARDRGLATELVYGVLRATAALDRRLGAHCRDGVSSLAKLDPYTRAVLRVGAWQILALDRVPARAAVDSAVESVKKSRSPRLAGFVNAVLRKLAGERPEPLPDDARWRLLREAVPARVVARVASVLGEAGAEEFLRASLSRAPRVTLRMNPARCADRDALRELLRGELPEAEIIDGSVSPWALGVLGGGDITRTRTYAQGVFGVQEEAAQAVAMMAEVTPGMRVLDVCAGRGGKSAVMASQLAGRGLLHAVDLHAPKLERLREELTRLGLTDGITLATFAADLSRGLGGAGRAAPKEGYDAVVVDAPCSGLGTLAHHPDLLLRLREDSAWSDLAALQHTMLTRVADHVAPGATLVYAVCTLTREEGDDVVAKFLAERPDFALAEGTERSPEKVRAARVVLDGRDGTDGFMAFRMRRARGVGA